MKTPAVFIDWLREYLGLDPLPDAIVPPRSPRNPMVKFQEWESSLAACSSEIPDCDPIRLSSDDY